MAKAKAKPKAKAKAKSAGAAKVLFAEIGKPDNINTVAVENAACIKKWLALDAVARAGIVAELATALDAMRSTAVWQDICTSAWNIKYEFTQMVALGRAIDRLVRARIPLDEPTLVKLAHVVAERSDLSVLRLTAQLEHYGKTQVVGPDLRAAMLALIERFASSDDAAMRARLSWLTAPTQAERIGVTSATPR